MRNIDVIEKEIENLINSPDIEKDPNGLEKYIALYKEYLQAHGVTVLETRCPICSQRVDDPQSQEHVKLELKERLLDVIYICPDCRTENPISLRTHQVTPDPSFN